MDIEDRIRQTLARKAAVVRPRPGAREIELRHRGGDRTRARRITTAVVALTLSVAAIGALWAAFPSNSPPEEPATVASSVQLSVQQRIALPGKIAAVAAGPAGVWASLYEVDGEANRYALARIVSSSGSVTLTTELEAGVDALAVGPTDVWAVTTNGKGPELLLVDARSGTVTSRTGGVGAPLVVAENGVWAYEPETSSLVNVLPSGSIEASIRLDGTPLAAAMDGQRIWVLERMPDDSNRLFGYGLATGETVGDLSLGPSFPAIAATTDDVWVSTSLDASSAALLVDARTGEASGRPFPIAGTFRPFGAAAFGALFIADSAAEGKGAQVCVLDRVSGDVGSCVSVGTPAEPIETAVAWDGTSGSVWVATASGDVEQLLVRVATHPRCK